ncbi:hypothetical protein [Candidatus Poriferisodalis sp.]|uniref:hypothetical protein n=1 Tax=Candidatus Poriferisodalis sp. TaxID=3101277 RepID=UPI003C6FABCD
MDEETEGSLMFTPAVVMAVHEDALLRHPDLVAQIESDQADSSRAICSEARRSRGP